MALYKDINRSLYDDYQRYLDNAGGHCLPLDSILDSQDHLPSKDGVDVNVYKDNEVVDTYKASEIGECEFYVFMPETASSLYQNASISLQLGVTATQAEYEMDDTGYMVYDKFESNNNTEKKEQFVKGDLLSYEYVREINNEVIKDTLYFRVLDVVGDDVTCLGFSNKELSFYSDKNDVKYYNQGIFYALKYADSYLNNQLASADNPNSFYNVIQRNGFEFVNHFKKMSFTQAIYNAEKYNDNSLQAINDSYKFINSDGMAINLTYVFEGDEQEEYIRPLCLEDLYKFYGGDVKELSSNDFKSVFSKVVPNELSDSKVWILDGFVGPYNNADDSYASLLDLKTGDLLTNVNLTVDNESLEAGIAFVFTYDRNECDSLKYVEHFDNTSDDDGGDEDVDPNAIEIILSFSSINDAAYTDFITVFNNQVNGYNNKSPENKIEITNLTTNTIKNSSQQIADIKNRVESTKYTKSAIILGLSDELKDSSKTDLTNLNNDYALVIVDQKELTTLPKDFSYSYYIMNKVEFIGQDIVSSIKYDFEYNNKVEYIILKEDNEAANIACSGFLGQLDRYYGVNVEEVFNNAVDDTGAYSAVSGIICSGENFNMLFVCGENLLSSAIEPIDEAGISHGYNQNKGVLQDVFISTIGRKNLNLLNSNDINIVVYTDTGTMASKAFEYINTAVINNEFVKGTDFSVSPKIVTCLK